MHNVPSSSNKNPYQSDEPTAHYEPTLPPQPHTGGTWNLPYQGPTFTPAVPVSTSPSAPAYNPSPSTQPHNTNYASHVQPQNGLPTTYGQLNQQQWIGQGLPPINPDQYSKRVKAIYSGLDDIFSFYNQLHNASAQWGVFLKNLSTVHKNVSLCPSFYCSNSNGAICSYGCYLV
jgi:hypothetical protein